MSTLITQRNNYVYNIYMYIINCRPKLRFGDYMSSLSDDSESVEPKLILKRASKESTSAMDKASIMSV